MDLVNARARRRFSRGLKRKPMALIKRLRKAKQEAKPLERPRGIKTHLRNMIIVPEMIGSVIGIYNGKAFNGVEIKVCSRTLDHSSRGRRALTRRVVGGKERGEGHDNNMRKILTRFPLSPLDSPPFVTVLCMGRPKRASSLMIYMIWYIHASGCLH